MNEVQRIDLNDYVQTGEGGTAQAYTHKNGRTLAKLFLASMAAENAIREFRMSQVVYEIGVPIPVSSRRSPTSWCRCLSDSPCSPSRYTRPLPTRRGCRTCENWWACGLTGL